MKKILKGFLFTLLAALILIIGYILVTFPTVMAGMVSKTLCSCMFVTGRSLESIKAKELTVFPGLSSAGVEINSDDSTVVASVLWKKSKSVYRKGLGCTLLAQRSEDEVRAQKINIPPSPVVDQDSLVWPSGNMKQDTILSDVKYDVVQKAVTNAFADVDPQKPIFTHAVIVVYKGQIIAEKYAEGFDVHSRLMGWSMTKSIMNALIGLLVKDGKLSVNAPAPVREWQEDERNEITLNDLLHASSGLNWNESYFIPSSDFHTMFIKSDDKAAYAADQKLAHKPGAFFQYSSGTSNIISRIVRETTGNEMYYRFPYERLFYKIGMNSALLEPDASGTFVGSSYSYATARDWARFGLLYLNDGVWNGERILPEGWVKYTSTPAPAAKKQQYGAQWWLNLGNPDNPEDLEYPGLPKESLMAEGFEKQIVLIVPSRQLVVVRLGVTHNKNFSMPNLVNGILEGLPH